MKAPSQTTGPVLGRGAFAHVRRSDTRAGKPAHWVHRDQILDWVREVTLQQHNRSILAAVAYAPAEDERDADVVVIKALLHSFEEALLVLGELPAAPAPGGTDAQTFLEALKRGHVVLPDPERFCLATGWHVDRRGETAHWLHAHLPRPSRYGQRAYERFLAATSASPETEQHARKPPRGAISGP